MQRPRTALSSPENIWSDKAMKQYLEIEISQEAIESMMRLGKVWEKAKENETNMITTKSSMESHSKGWVKTWKVPGSSGNEYTVALHKNGFYGCTCPAWTFQSGAAKDRKNCKHILKFLATPHKAPEPKKKEWVWF